ncbi:uncharacterized protein [Gossypium hirsutum]|uniref:Uncharacterized protein n=1 Tax=Gossypium hirsutum TaxID=3635 RepID=A0ABM3AA50_GOSHI|nr:uncharacterized protein LOC107901586 [Gossypium hirsutum]
MGEENKKIRKEEVIAKLKDNGDFDKLRLKIIRKLKDNLRRICNNIISAVKQSAALNRLGSENMKVRQLSDAIHDEVGIFHVVNNVNVNATLQFFIMIRNKVMGQISDSLWEIIRSKGSTRTGITETVVSHRNNNKSKLASCFPQPS